MAVFLVDFLVVAAVDRQSCNAAACAVLPAGAPGVVIVYY